MYGHKAWGQPCRAATSPHCALTKKKEKNSSSGGHRPVPQACILCWRSWILCQYWELNIGHKGHWDLKQCHVKLWEVHRKDKRGWQPRDNTVRKITWRVMGRGVWCGAMCSAVVVRHHMAHGVLCFRLWHFGTEKSQVWRGLGVPSPTSYWPLMSLNS